MALTTRKQLRRLVCETDFGEILYGTATSGGTDHLIDTDKLRSSVRSPERLQQSWISLTNGDANDGKDRLISTYLNLSGRVNFDNAISEAVASGDEYEIHDILSKTQWDKVIDDGLARCTRRGTILVTIVEGQTHYDLKTIDPTLELADDVLAVIVREGEAGSYDERELPPYAWKVEDDGDSVWLKLRTPIGPDTDNDRVIAVRAVLPYAALASDAATTGCPVQWARAAIAVSAYELYGRTIEAGARGAVNINQQQAAASFTDLTTRYAPQYDRPIGEAW